MKLWQSYKKMSLFWKLSIPCLLVLIIGIAIQGTTISLLLNSNTREAAIKSAENIITQYRSLRAYYTDNIVRKVRQNHTLDVGFDHKNVENQIPLPATMIMDLSDIFAKNNLGVQIKLYSSLPFPNRASRSLDSFQREALEYFKKNPEGIFVRDEETISPRQIRVALADRMVSQSCVECHNSHPQSPFRDWKIGDVRGVLEVSTNIESVSQANAKIVAATWGASLLMLIAILAVLGAVLRQLRRPLETTTKEIRQANQEILDISESLLSASSDLTASATRQASNFTETSVALDSMTMMVKGNLTFANQATEDSQNLLNVSKNAQDAMRELMGAMRDILEANQRIDQVVKIIEEIGDKTEIIDEIVFKTQLLSFNASVEAERAGEHGRGFAVVAQEVGNLAQVSGRAATEIAQIVKQSIRESGVVAEDNRHRVIRGNELTERTQQHLDEVLKKLENIMSSINHIAIATGEQSQNIEQITESINQLTQVANITSGNAEIASASSSSLSAKSRRLQKMIGDLSDLMNGTN